jgi:hypothetical protein
LDVQNSSLFKKHKINLPHFAKLLSFLIIRSKKFQKPHVSTVLPDKDDDPSFIDTLLTTLDLKNTLSAAKATKIADDKQTSLRYSSGLDEHLSVAEARDTADVAKARKDREAQAQHGLFSQLRSHMSILKSPFNRNDTPAPVDVSLDETPGAGLTRHANNLYDNLYFNHHLFNRNDTPAQVEVSLDETPQTGITRHANNLYDDPYHNHPIDEGMEFNGVRSPNHDPLMPIPESPAATTRIVNFKINNHDDSNTPTRKFNFGEKSHPYTKIQRGY